MGGNQSVVVTPVPRLSFILAKLIPYWLIALFVITVCLLLLSGLFTPVRSMPFWSYLTTYVNPMHYFIDAIRTVFLRGGGLSAIAPQVLALVLIGLTMAAWAVKSYKKNG